MRAYQRGGRTVRPFEPLEDDIITDRRLDGLGTTAIARELYRYTGYRRSPATINMRLKSLAAREDDGQ